MEKILVTGATGFVGSAIVRRLLRLGAQVRVTVRAGSNLQNLAGLAVEQVQADIGSPGGMVRAMHGCSQLYHVAGLYRSWMRDYSLLRQFNVEGTRTVLSAARDAGIHKIVYTSSIAALGMRFDGKPADESTAFNLQDMRLPYEQSKYEAELVAREFIRNGLPVVIVRPALVMGPGDIYPTPSGKIVLDILKRRVPCYFDGGIDIVDVDDVAAGHVLAMEKALPGAIFNLGCMENFVTIGELFSLIGQAGGVRPPFLKMPLPLTMAYAWALTCLADILTHREPLATPANIRILSLKRRVDFSKAVHELGIPQTPLRNVVQRTVDWYRQEGYA